MAIVLKIEHLDGSTAEVKLTKEGLTLGRSSKSSYKIDDEMVSGTHLQIHLSNKKSIVFRDLGSSNGTFLNGARFDKGELKIGDSLSIGKTYIEIDKSKLTKSEKETYAQEVSRPNITMDYRSQELELDIPEQDEDALTSVDLSFSNAEPVEEPTKNMQVPVDKEPEQKEQNHSESSNNSDFSVDIKEDEPEDESDNKEFENASGYTSSGQTKFIKLEKPKIEGESSKPKKKKKKKKVKKEEKSLVGKISNLFKK